MEGQMEGRTYGVSLPEITKINIFPWERNDSHCLRCAEAKYHHEKALEKILMTSHCQFCGKLLPVYEITGFYVYMMTYHFKCMRESKIFEGIVHLNIL